MKYRNNKTGEVVEACRVTVENPQELESWFEQHRTLNQRLIMGSSPMLIFNITGNGNPLVVHLRAGDYLDASERGVNFRVGGYFESTHTPADHPGDSNGTPEQTCEQRLEKMLAKVGWDAEKAATTNAIYEPWTIEEPPAPSKISLDRAIRQMEKDSNQPMDFEPADPNSLIDIENDLIISHNGKVSRFLQTSENAWRGSFVREWFGATFGDTIYRRVRPVDEVEEMPHSIV